MPRISNQNKHFINQFCVRQAGKAKDKENFFIKKSEIKNGGKGEHFGHKVRKVN